MVSSVASREQLAAGEHEQEDQAPGEHLFFVQQREGDGEREPVDQMKGYGEGQDRLFP